MSAKVNRPQRRMSAPEVGIVITVMALFVGTGVGVILTSAEAASVAFGIGLVVAIWSMVAVAYRARREEKK